MQRLGAQVRDGKDQARDISVGDNSLMGIVIYFVSGFLSEPEPPSSLLLFCVSQSPLPGLD